MRTMAVIPAYNEEKHIMSVVNDAAKYVSDIIVVDDRSKDRTTMEALRQGASVVTNVSDQHGAGFATQLGIDYALARGADAVVTLDGDGQHDPGEIPRLLDALGNADLVTGVRSINRERMPKYRIVGNRIIISYFNLMFGTWGDRWFCDILCGFRAMTADTARKVRITEPTFGFTVETMAKALALGLSVAEVPVTTRYNGNLKADSSMAPIKHGLTELRSVTKWRLKTWG